MLKLSIAVPTTPGQGTAAALSWPREGKEGWARERALRALRAWQGSSFCEG